MKGESAVARRDNPSTSGFYAASSPASPERLTIRPHRS